MTKLEIILLASTIVSLLFGFFENAYRRHLCKSKNEMIHKLKSDLDFYVQWIGDEAKQKEQQIEALKLYIYSEKDENKSFSCLKDLCKLKHYKDKNGKDDYYKKVQPKLWEKANKIIDNAKD